MLSFRHAAAAVLVALAVAAAPVLEAQELAPVPGVFRAFAPTLDVGRDRKDFEVDSTYSGLPGPQLVQRVREEGYRVEGVYIGTG